MNLQNLFNLINQAITDITTLKTKKLNKLIVKPKTVKLTVIAWYIKLNKF